MTFAKACSHIENFTSAHESRTGFYGTERLNYASDHIEVDHRLSWFLGKLDTQYGDDAFYVHLKRDIQLTAASYLKRWDFGIIAGYSQQILMGTPHKEPDPLEICLDFCDTVNSNIEMFLKDKRNKMTFTLENADEDFEVFWKKISAKGNYDDGLAEWKIKHNASA